MEGSAEAGAAEDGSGSGASGRTAGSLNDRVYTVLLVEDDALTCKTVSRTLQQCSYEVIVAANGREALEVMEGPQGAHIDVILTDNLMPEVSGVELIIRLVQSERWQHVPVIVMSAESRQEAVLEAFEAGASDFLIKPIRRNELATLWQHAWRAARGCQTPRTPRGVPMPGSPSGHGSAHASNTRFQLAAPGPDRSASPSAAAPPSSSSDDRPLATAAKRGASSGSREAQQAPAKRARILEALTQAASAERSGGSGGGGARLRSSLQPDELEDGGTRSSDASDDTGARRAPAAVEQRAVASASKPLEPTPWQSSVEGVAHLMQQLARRTSEAAPLEITPLDVSPLPAARQASLPFGASSAKLDEGGAPGGGLEQLHHSAAHSAFSSFTAVVPRPCARGEVEGEACESGGLGGLPSVFANPQSTLLQQQQSFFQAFEAAMTQHQQTVVACAANRKAAIAKFRAKRKSRSFEKKVRYASRQRLAESRPRVRGQFVKADVFAAHAAAGGDKKAAEE